MHACHTVFFKENAGFSKLFGDFDSTNSIKYCHEYNWYDEYWNQKCPDYPHQVMPTNKLKEVSNIIAVYLFFNEEHYN
jgi:hypothetical protein